MSTAHIPQSAAIGRNACLGASQKPTKNRPSAKALAHSLVSLVIVTAMISKTMMQCYSKSWVKSDRGASKDNRNLLVVTKTVSGEIRMTQLGCCLPLYQPMPMLHCPFDLQLQKRDVSPSFDVVSSACSIVSSVRLLQPL